MVNRALEGRKFGKSTYYEIKYEDFVSDPYRYTEEMLRFCELEIYDKFFEMIPKITNENIKWKTRLTEKERDDIEEATSKLRSLLNYS